MAFGNSRADFINYRKPGIFMITINKLPSIPVFSRIIVKENETILHKKYTTERTPLGNAVNTIIRKIPFLFPKLALHQYVIMPNHIHIILEIKEEIDEELGVKIARLKRKMFHHAVQTGFSPSFEKTLFETGFNDLFLKRNMKLNTLYNYVRENPYRYWEVITNPEFFNRKTEENFCGTTSQLYGNFFLLKTPFIYAVVVHRRYSPKQIEELRKKWTHAIENGGVLIGAFVSKEEKLVLEEAIEKRGKIILLKNHPLREKEKPKGKLFYHCRDGKLLRISPEMNFNDIVYPDGRLKTKFRRECEFLNGIAEKIGK